MIRSGNHNDRTKVDDDKIPKLEIPASVFFPDIEIHPPVLVVAHVLDLNSTRRYNNVPLLQNASMMATSLPAYKAAAPS